MVKQYSIALLVFLLSFAVHGQDKHIADSLLQAYQAARHDTVKINCLLEIGQLLIGPDIDSVLIIEKEILLISERNLKNQALSKLESIAFKVGKAEALNNIGYIYKMKGDIQLALDNYQGSLALQRQLNSREGIATSLNNIAIIFEETGDISKSLNYHHEGLEIIEELGDAKGISISLNNLGKLYLTQGDTINALVYFKKSLDQVRNTEFKSGEAYTLSNLGYLYELKSKQEKAFTYYNMAIAIRIEIGDKRGLSQSYNNLAAYYKKLAEQLKENSAHEDSIQNKIEKAQIYFHRSLQLKEEIGWKKGEAYTLQNLGTLLLEQGDIIEAKKYAQSSMELAKELGYPDVIRRASGLLYSVYKKEGNYKEALISYELHILMRDSLKNEENHKAVIRQQTKYEFEKAQLLKEQEEKETARRLHEQISRRDNLQYSIVFICLLAIGILIAFLGKLSLSERMAEALIFFAFLIFFEFMLVLADPYIEDWSGGAPGFKLMFNAGIAAMIFPLHSLIETKLKERLVH